VISFLLIDGLPRLVRMIFAEHRSRDGRASMGKRRQPSSTPWGSGNPAKTPDETTVPIRKRHSVSAWQAHEEAPPIEPFPLSGDFLSLHACARRIYLHELINAFPRGGPPTFRTYRLRLRAKRTIGGFEVKLLHLTNELSQSLVISGPLLA